MPNPANAFSHLAARSQPSGIAGPFAHLAGPAGSAAVASARDAQRERETRDFAAIAQRAEAKLEAAINPPTPKRGLAAAIARAADKASRRTR